ncbi:MAG: cobalamin biosynthesis protein [Actinomycetota bacterium]|nr:cobalamin biosynthesis protein [Actinomycetota bacterium]
MSRWWGLAGGYLLDLVFAESLLRPHPVAMAGSALQWWEENCYRDARAAGVAYVAGGLAMAEAAARLAPVGAAATYIAVAQSMLLSEARAVKKLLDAGDLPEARLRACSLVGRDTAALEEAGLARAVVESVAENTVDGVVAPLLWAAAGGARGAYFYRIINTMDSQVGHRNERYRRFGSAAARLDDVANYLPARVAALLLMALRPGRAVAAAQVIRDGAPAHPSPNAGVIEAGFAAALHVRLGGVNSYGGVTEERGTLGDGPAPSAPDIEAACRLSRAIGLATLGLVGVVELAASRWRAR